MIGINLFSNCLLILFDCYNHITQCISKGLNLKTHYTHTVDKEVYQTSYPTLKGESLLVTTFLLKKREKEL